MPAADHPPRVARIWGEFDNGRDLEDVPAEPVDVLRLSVPDRTMAVWNIAGSPASRGMPSRSPTT
jgi:hypothetical protein